MSIADATRALGFSASTEVAVARSSNGKTIILAARQQFDVQLQDADVVEIDEAGRPCG